MTEIDNTKHLQTLMLLMSKREGFFNITDFMIVFFYPEALIFSRLNRPQCF